MRTIEKNRSHGKIYWKHEDNVYGATRAAIFDAVIGAGIIRNIVYVKVSLVGGTTRTDIERFDGTNYTVQFAAYADDDQANIDVPNSWDPEKPIMTLQQDYNLYALCTGGTVDVAVAYWDDEDV